MATLNFNIQSTSKDFFEKIISLFKDFPPYNKLRKQERFVLSRLMYYYYIIGLDIKDDVMINVALFDNIYKNKIAEEMMLEDEDGKAFEKAFAKFSNVLTTLRKKDLIIRKNGKNVLNSAYLFKPAMTEVIFKFNISN